MLVSVSCLMLCWAGLYTPGFQGGPGEIGVLNSYWSSGWGTVSAVGVGRSEDAPLGYSSWAG